MPVRLAGLLHLEADDRPTTEALESEWGARYPACPPWERSVHRLVGATVFLDTCGDSQAIAVDQQSGSGIAGTIRLDRRDVLRAELGEQVSIAISDHALVLLAYRRWGPNAFSRLRGDFAFLAWDSRERTFWLVRDAFGIRRLHYAIRDDTLVFASDVEGVLAWPGISREPDDVTILDNLLGHYQTRERTFFQDIKRVLPGHFLRIAPSGVQSVRYLEPPHTSPVFASLKDYAEALREELARSVAERIPDSGNVVCHVSGGLDSASVASLSAAHLAREGSGRKAVLATARFPGLGCDEGPIAQELGRWLGLAIHEWDGLRPETSDLEAGRVAWPFGRSSIGGSYQGDLDVADRFGAGVLLSGLGGNQISCESGFFRDCFREGRFMGFSRGLFQIVRGRPWRWEFRHFRRSLLEARRVARGAVPWGTNRDNATPAEGRMPRWLGPRLGRAWLDLPGELTPPPANVPATGSWMADAIWEKTAADPNLVWTLEYEDARAAERGLEFRYPYLSWSLLALAMAIPWHLRAPSDVDRQWQRLGLIGILPERLRLRNTFADFNEGNLLNTQCAAVQIEGLLAGGPWASEGFVNRRLALEDYRRLSSCPTARLPAVPYEPWEPWRQIRDVAALEAWLRRV